MFSYLFVTPVNQLWKQAGVRSYSKWFYTWSEVIVIQGKVGWLWNCIQNEVHHRFRLRVLCVFKILQELQKSDFFCIISCPTNHFSTITVTLMGGESWHHVSWSFFETSTIPSSALSFSSLFSGSSSSKLSLSPSKTSF